MNTFWFLVIVFLNPQGGAYLDGEMLPRVAPSETACYFKMERTTQIHKQVQAMYPTLNDADILCLEAASHEELKIILNRRYNFGGNPA